MALHSTVKSPMPYTGNASVVSALHQLDLLHSLCGLTPKLTITQGFWCVPEAAIGIPLLPSTTECKAGNWG